MTNPVRWNRPLLEKIIKLLVFAGSSWYLYYRISNSQRPELTFSFDIAPGGLLTGILLLIILWAMNITLEVAKWRFLLAPVARMNWLTAYKSVLTGQTIGVFTPNKMGEYIGKILFVDHRLRIKAIFSSLVGSFSQLNVTLMMGCIGIVWYMKGFFEGSQVLANTFIVVVWGITGLSLLLFFNISMLVHYVRTHRSLRFLKKYITALEAYHMRELFMVLFYSIGRYIVFSSQFVLLLYMFGSKAPLFDCWMATTAMYLVQAALPTLGFFEVTMRSDVAVLFFTDCLGLEPVISTSASLLLWFINIIIPAAMGLLFIFETSFFKWKQPS
jgi:hypothetical protein